MWGKIVGLAVGLRQILRSIIYSDLKENKMWGKNC